MKVRTVQITLPYPPSVNTYWRSIRTGKLAGRVLVSEKGREYQAAVGKAVKRAKLGKPLTTRLAVDVLVYPPDRRARDLDNVLKALLDSCQKAAVFVNDSQIDTLLIERRWPVPDGRVELRISEVVA